MSLSVRADDLVELMDDPGCDAERLAATLRRFEVVNRLVSGWGGIYRRRLLPFLQGLGRPAEVLDLGSGGGDLVRRLAAQAARDGVRVRWTGADPDPRSHAVAVAADVPHAAEFRCIHGAALVAEGARFDAVISNHVLHHLGADLPSFAAESRMLSSGLVLHADIARSRVAYGLYTVGITPLAPGTFLRTDGLRSIRRSYTVAELQDALDAADPGAWRVTGAAPFRVLAESAGRA